MGNGFIFKEIEDFFKMYKILIFSTILFLCSATTEVYGQVDTMRLKRGIPPPPPPPSPKIDTTVFKVVEDMPRFPGCEHLPKEERKACSDKKLLDFIYDHIIYPAEAKEKGITGTVVVSWVVEKDGTMTSFEIKKDIGGGCGAEVLRVLNLMNEKGIRWTSSGGGKSRARPVRVQYNLPIRFTEEMMHKN